MTLNMKKREKRLGKENCRNLNKNGKRIDYSNEDEW